MATIPNITSLVTVIQAAAHPWMAALDVKDTFFMIPLREQNKTQFAFTWEGRQHIFSWLLQGSKYYPTIAHNVLAVLLDTLKVPSGIHIYQYIDAILVGRDNKEVGQVAEAIWNQVTKKLIRYFIFQMSRSHAES